MGAIKFSSDLPLVVGTVHSPGSLRRALKLKAGAVDLLELRVDHFAADPTPLVKAIPHLGFPLIVTVRHPLEGGAEGFSFTRRRELYAELLPHAALVDVELRSLPRLAATVAQAREAGVAVIASSHHFRSTPSEEKLGAIRKRAASAGADVCKIAAHVAGGADLGRLLALLTPRRQPRLSVMGMGAFGKVSRLLFAQVGSVLNYGYLDEPNAPGQWEATLLKQRIAELRAP